jgi:hypothetical protein
MVMVPLGGRAVTSRRLSRTGSTVAWQWPFSMGVRGSSMKMGRNNTIGGLGHRGPAAGLTGGQRIGDLHVRISIGNLGGQRVSCYCRETFCPIDLDLGTLVYRFRGLMPLS